MKVKADFKELNQNMQNQQKETDQEQDKKMTEIEDKIKSIISSMEDKSAFEENSKKLSEL